jgi:hypothetical protein
MENMKTLETVQVPGMVPIYGSNPLWPRYITFRWMLMVSPMLKRCNRLLNSW